MENNKSDSTFLIPKQKEPISNKFIGNLALYVAIALVLGIIVGHYFPKRGIQLEFLGFGFLYLIEPFIQPIIFLTIIIGISSVGNLRKVGRIGLKAIIYFQIITTLALITGALAAVLLQPGKIDRNFLTMNNQPEYNRVVSLSGDWYNFLILNRPLLFLLLAIVVGCILNSTKHREKLVLTLEKIRNLLYKILFYIFYLIPIAAFGGMAYAVSKFGINSLLPLGKLLATTYITMAFFVFVILGGILRYYKMSLWKFLLYIKEELLIIFGTSSSRTAFPLIVKKLEKLGCSKPVVGLVIPLGYSFNLVGASIFLPISTLFIAQLYNIPLSFYDIITIILIITVTSKSASGVPGSGFIALATTLSILHNFPMEGLAFLFSIDKFMNEARTITNFIGNGVATIVISKFENDFIANDEINLSIKSETI